jgi:hypothetical protein
VSATAFFPSPGLRTSPTLHANHNGAQIRNRRIRGTGSVATVKLAVKEDIGSGKDGVRTVEASPVLCREAPMGVSSNA